MDEPTSFSHLTPEARIYYGRDALPRLTAELKRAGCSRAVVVCGRSLARDEGGLGRVAAALGDAFAGSFAEVEPHSPVEVVTKASEALRSLEADAVVALGGGSAIVTARAAGILLAEKRPPAELSTVFEPGKPPHSPRLTAPKLPQFVIATTPTTACTKAGAAVFDTALRRRLTMFDPQTRARALFLDPDMAMQVPLAVFRDAALNTFALAVQGLESSRRQPLADSLLIQAVRLLRDHLPLVGTAQDGAGVRGNIVLAAVLTGQGTDHTGGGLTSVLGHSFGARCHVSNGMVNAILLPHVMRFNAETTGERLRPLLEVLRADASISGSVGMAAAESCARFLSRLGVPARLGDIGIGPDSFNQVFDDATADFFFYQAPRRINDRATLHAILQQAS